MSETWIASYDDSVLIGPADVRVERRVVEIRSMDDLRSKIPSYVGSVVLSRLASPTPEPEADE